MKADASGTLSEQKRAQAGWYAATDRPQCKSCSHADATYPDRAPPFDKPSYRCKLLDFTTQPGAACLSFRK